MPQLTIYEILSTAGTIAFFIVGLMIKNEIARLKLIISENHSKVIEKQSTLDAKFDGHEELDQERFNNLNQRINSLRR